MAVAPRSMVALLLLGGAPAARAQDVPKIAAAADLRPALTVLAAEFKRASGSDVAITFGASGIFARQLAQGAPYQLFLSADQNLVFDLAKAGVTEGQGAAIGVGRLAFVAAKGSMLAADVRRLGLRAALSRAPIEHFAIANPEHAPYGARAADVLHRAGLWNGLRDRLVLGETVSQALEFVLSGNAQGGIVALPIASDPALATRIEVVAIPQAWHRPLVQQMVLIRGAGAVARRFYAYLRQPAARRVFARYGLAPPSPRSVGLD
ncbi:molybdate ABC transporter substrate-binding protein [soil metagenome]